MKTRAGKKGKPPCKNCGKPVKRRPNQYGSSSCFGVFKRRKIVEADFGKLDTRLLKRYLLEERGHRCQVCGITEWMGRPAPIELDHKDGDPLNNEIENLRLICPNCHAQTHPYKGRNRGRGRHYRRERYAQGKSY
ncbi:MAG TPA: HNH endonuclease signature motif containing protein [Blastocatellia bacterium]|nr:HNH endonuclease signature motif containing protein [Blastocatellia bacterium]